MRLLLPPRSRVCGNMCQVKMVQLRGIIDKARDRGKRIRRFCVDGGNQCGKSEWLSRFPSTFALSEMRMQNGKV